MSPASATIKKHVQRLVTALIATGCAALQAVPPAIDFASNEIAIVLSQEPQWLNTVKATDQISFILLDHISEGLMTYDINNELTGGVAKRWELTDDKATFWLREDARWSDGKPVTAHDFVFAWQLSQARQEHPESGHGRSSRHFGQPCHC